ncbi:MAG: hypothetical protein Fur0037_22570 [Planctomycetota bacterium]
MTSHPDRQAPTLAQVRPPGGPFDPPKEGSFDARVDLKLLAHAARRAIGLSEKAREHLARFDEQEHPDLWAGTVRDGVARGFCAALEEAVSLAPPPAPAPPPVVDPLKVKTFVGRELRRKQDLLVASGGARIRFSRRQGVLLVDRERRIESANCLRFDDLRDCGTLDGFEAPPHERPRLFSAQFLHPSVLRQGPDFDELVLDGRLGRTAAGFPVRIVFTGRKSEPFVTLRIALENRHRDHRLRMRLLGVPEDAVRHSCTDVCRRVDSPAGGFLAFTLVRACGRLSVDGEVVEVPGAQCLCRIEHEFRLG